MAKKCNDCITHDQVLPPEIWIVVQEYKSDFKKNNPNHTGVLSKSDAINKIIMEWKTLKFK